MTRIVRSALLTTALCLVWPAPVAEAEQDAVLRKVARLVRPGWELRVNGETLVIRRKRPAWVLWENRINAFVGRETPEQRVARIKQHGRRVHPAMVFHVETRWSPAKLAAARRQNAALRRRMGALVQKHRVAHLLERNHGKHTGPPPGITKAERARYAAFEAESERLQRQIVRLPSYHTTRYSLFFARYDGWSDSFHQVYPDGVERESYALDRRVRQALIPAQPRSRR